MLIYWAMFTAAALGALVAEERGPGAGRTAVPWLGVAFALLVGLRHQVGADWFNYESYFLQAAPLSLQAALSRFGDPGYYGVGWAIAQAGGGIHALNLVCASSLLLGVVWLVRDQPHPLLGLVAAVPYLIVVVGMGYTRQSAAIGCAMVALVALGQGRAASFVGWTLLAVAFHKSAVLVLPLGAIVSPWRRLPTAVVVLVLTAAVGWLVLRDAGPVLWRQYVVSNYAFRSQGASFRVAMNVPPALLVLAFGRTLDPAPARRRLWVWLALAALACVPMLWLSPTATDRAALYLLPLQLYVFGRIPRLAGRPGFRTLLGLATVASFGLVQFVWFGYSLHARYWLPYRFMPL